MQYTAAERPLTVKKHVHLKFSHHPDNGGLLGWGGSADDDRAALGAQLGQQGLLGGLQHMLQSLPINHQLPCRTANLQYRLQHHAGDHCFLSQNLILYGTYCKRKVKILSIMTHVILVCYGTLDLC